MLNHAADSELVGAFRWRDAKANRLAGTAQAGQFGAYDGSGFVLDVTNLTTSYLVESFEFLEENTWLDRQTRAVFISLIVYNANFNLYSVLQFSLELSLAGVLTPKYNLQTVKMVSARARARGERNGVCGACAMRGRRLPPDHALAPALCRRARRISSSPSSTRLTSSSR